MINQITKIKLPDGDEVALTDWSQRPIYSTVEFLAGMTDEELRAFNYTTGELVSTSNNLQTALAAGARTATLADTNISQAAEIAAVEEYLVYAVKVEYFQLQLSSAAADTLAAGLPMPHAPAMKDLHRQLVLSLEVSEKDFSQMGLGWFNTGFGPSGFVTSTAGPVTYANAGDPTHEAASYLALPTHLGGTEDFAVLLQKPGPNALQIKGDAAILDTTAIFSLRIIFDGLQKRPTG